jgi:transposase
MPDADRVLLERIVRDGRNQQRIVRRARILLAMQDQEALVEEVAYVLGVARSTVWRVCRRYEERGLESLCDAARCGRPRPFPPLGAGAN